MLGQRRANAHTLGGVGPCGAGDPGGTLVGGAWRALADGRALRARTGGRALRERTAPTAKGPRGQRDQRDQRVLWGQRARLYTTNAIPNGVDMSAGPGTN